MVLLTVFGSCKMARTDRLFRLLQAMRNLPSPCTAARLAQETGVSIRSIYRDVDSLRAAGAKIEGERGYGYCLIEDNSLKPQAFNRIELEALALGLAEVKHLGDADLAKAAHIAFTKIAAMLPRGRDQELFHAISQVYQPSPRYTIHLDIEVIRHACWHERAVHICYRDSNGSVTERTILPLTIMYTSEAITILAWCLLREEFRMFRFDRIIELASTGKSFRPRRIALLREYLTILKAREQELRERG